MTNPESHIEHDYQDAPSKNRNIKGESPDDALHTNVIGLQFLDCSLEAAAELLIHAANAGQKRDVFFVNAHCINIASRNPAYALLLQEAKLLFADGAGMAMAARIWGTRLRNNLNGTDLFPHICSLAAMTRTPIALLGANEGVAQLCAENLRNLYPGIKIVYVNHGFMSNSMEAQEIDILNKSAAQILFVAKGVPTQELWIQENSSKLNIPVILGVGALFDFYSGSIPRAPETLRKLRLEWLFRLLLEPKRMFHRYVIGNPEFILRVLKLRFTQSH
ncbi:MAG: WecB/TagA/CpsF family glycosyltransferase [Gammaproteobacteria bacterium]|nr:WecB/TagA/CpsF family glycosyltransferase [Gammaproteobacteria bacterium]MCP4928650.1 WecB/TagA/CpsF family glycosyltransferase [Gammaproteobacteria bacterium]